MRICANCGAEIPEGYKFCAKCGAPAPSDETADETEESEVNVNENARQKEEPVNKTEKPADNTEKPADNPDTEKKSKDRSTPRMRWHGFLIYFDLFLAVIIYLLLALETSTGTMYLDDMVAVYTLYPGMQALNVLFGIFNLCMAVMALVVRMRLAHHRKNGPGLYIRWLWTALIGVAVYEMIVCMITGRFTIFLTAYSLQEFALYTGVPALIMIIYILLNLLYYQRSKRKALFVR